MRMPAPPASPILFAISAAVVGALLVANGACNTTGGQTPDCIPNVDARGVHAIDGGCEQFPTCPANASNPAACCTDGGAALTGSDLAICLYNYGGCVTLVTTADAMGNPVYECSSVYDAGGGSGGSGGGGTGGGNGG
jgi:hypothetical protein